MVSVIGAAGAAWILRPLGSLPFIPAVRLGDGVPTQQPWRRQGLSVVAMPTALWRCGLAKWLPHHAGEGRRPVVLGPVRHLAVGHSGRRSAAVGWAGIVRTEGTGPGIRCLHGGSDHWCRTRSSRTRWFDRKPPMIGTMNPLSWSFAVLIDLPAQERCPSERNRSGHHEPLMMTTMRPLSWHFLC